MSVAADMEVMARKAKEASRAMAAASGAAKDAFLARLAELLETRREGVLAANAADLEKARAAGLDAPRLDRLTLTPAVTVADRQRGRHLCRCAFPQGLRRGRLACPGDEPVRK